ncbi:hypothetical protein [Aquibacillus kalidii]|uniref:hypothetical protein n=1 Tax=Aquibacillus kalidii TaxID=2762597 RepID=UPI001647AFDA|nr:hypothetical protein [Aquibacillus kalidii]
MKRGTIFIVIVLMLLIGMTGCMSESSSQEAILTYLEEKYDEKFEVEAFKEGSDTFKQMYGADKIIVHPEGKPEHVFLAGEDRDHEGEYYDNYVLSIWSDELTRHYEKEINNILLERNYEVRLNILDEKSDSSDMDKSIFDYLKDNKDVWLILNVAIKTSEGPNINQYNKQILNLLKLIEGTGVKDVTVSVGFVNESTKIVDYIRTSAVNNIQWSNLVGDVYGAVTVDTLHNIHKPEHVNQYYEGFEE